MKQKGQWYGIMILTITAMIWGLSFVAQSVGMRLIRPFTFQCIRSFLGVLVLLPAVIIRLKKAGGGKIRITREMIMGGVQVGLALTVACCLQQFAMVTADAGKAAFLTANYLVIVPILICAMFGMSLIESMLYINPYVNPCFQNLMFFTLCGYARAFEREHPCKGRKE